MRLGVVILPDERWSTGADRWRRAETMGFDHAWTYDHLAWRTLRDEPWFGAVPTLVAAAAVTSTIRLGPLVASPNFRHPVPFAREVLSLDDVSDGRLTLGLGAGGTGWDATMLGDDPWPTRERADRFEEFVTLTDLLLRQPATSWRGSYYAADEARSAPGCVQQPRVPFAIAASGPRGMRLVAEHAATWVTTGDRSGAVSVPPADGAAIVARQLDALADACAAVGRDVSDLDRLVLTGPELDGSLASPGAFADAVGAYEAVGITDLVVHWPRSAEPYAGDLATFEEIFGSRP